MNVRLLKNWQEVLSRARGALLRRGRTEHEADDLVQEAWVRLACFEDGGREVEQPEAFVMRVALNLSIDAHRMRASHGHDVDVVDAVLIDTAPSVEAMVLAKERMARMSVGLSRLSPKTRNVFLSHRLDGMSYREIGQAHGISISAVHQHIAKATLKLTAWMEGW